MKTITFNADGFCGPDDVEAVIAVATDPKVTPKCLYIGGEK